MERNVILDSSSAAIQVAALLAHYPGLQQEILEKEIRLRGEILVSRVYDGFPILKTAGVMITVYIDSDKYPKIKDINNSISQDYPHRYPSGELCLATEFDLHIHFADGFDMLVWMKDFVEPYYYSYEYYQRFGCFPFGERAHGSFGKLQSYMDYFQTEDQLSTLRILKGIADNEYYHGSMPCFCGSLKRGKRCHKKILDFYNRPILRRQAVLDFNDIMTEVRKYDESSRATE